TSRGVCPGNQPGDGCADQLCPQRTGRTWARSFECAHRRARALCLRNSAWEHAPATRIHRHLWADHSVELAHQSANGEDRPGTRGRLHHDRQAQRVRAPQRIVTDASTAGGGRAGLLVARAAADSVKRVAQELGGKSPNILLDDVDLEPAVTRAVAACFTNSGQSCSIPTRLLLPRALLGSAE